MHCNAWWHRESNFDVWFGKVKQPYLLGGFTIALTIGRFDIQLMCGVDELGLSIVDFESEKVWRFAP